MVMMVRLFEVFILVGMGDTLTVILLMNMKITGVPVFRVPVLSP